MTYGMGLLSCKADIALTIMAAAHLALPAKLVVAFDSSLSVPASTAETSIQLYRATARGLTGPVFRSMLCRITWSGLAAG